MRTERLISGVLSAVFVTSCGSGTGLKNASLAVAPNADASVAAAGGGSSTGGMAGGGAGGGNDASAGAEPGQDAMDDNVAAPNVSSNDGSGVAAPEASSVGGGGAVSPAAGSGTWMDLAPMPGGGRSDGTGAVLNGLLFVVGGQGQNGNDVEAYDPKTNTWTTHVKFPALVNHANVAAVGDKLYVFGGRDSTASYAYNPFAPVIDRKWTAIKTIPGQRESAAVGVIGGKIYLVGGAVSHTDPPRADLFVYDPATDGWDTSQPPEPIGRTHQAAAVVDGILYVMAGRKFAERFTEPAGWLSSVYAYDPVAKTWTQKSDIPTPRSGCVGGVISGLIIVAGGEGAPGGGVFPQVEAYNPGTDQWTKLAPMKHPCNGQAQGGIDGKLYVAGGTNTNITDVLTLP
jgi:N-acetylneuraminic acid mutarotase